MFVKPTASRILRIITVPSLNKVKRDIVFQLNPLKISRLNVCLFFLVNVENKWRDKTSFSADRSVADCWITRFIDHYFDRRQRLRSSDKQREIQTWRNTNVTRLQGECSVDRATGTLTFTREACNRGCREFRVPFSVGLPLLAKGSSKNMVNRITPRRDVNKTSYSIWFPIYCRTESKIISIFVRSRI